MFKLKLLLFLIYLTIAILLVVAPLVYSIRNGGGWKSTKFTWIVWTVVLIIYGLSLPVIMDIYEKVTAKTPDYDGTIIGFGLFLGWIPGLFFSFVGKWIHYWYWMLKLGIDPNKKDIVTNKNKLKAKTTGGWGDLD